MLGLSCVWVQAPARYGPEPHRGQGCSTNGGLEAKPQGRVSTVCTLFHFVPLFTPLSLLCAQMQALLTYMRGCYFNSGIGISTVMLNIIFGDVMVAHVSVEMYKSVLHSLFQLFVMLLLSGSFFCILDANHLRVGSVLYAVTQGYQISNYK